MHAFLVKLRNSHFIRQMSHVVNNTISGKSDRIIRYARYPLDPPLLYVALSLRELARTKMLEKKLFLWFMSCFCFYSEN